jgi:hypothetical protein
MIPKRDTAHRALDKITRITPIPDWSLSCGDRSGMHADLPVLGSSGAAFEDIKPSLG